MQTENPTGVVPEQYTGKEIIAEASREFDSNEAAEAAYQKAKTLLMDVNRWSETGSLPGTKFQLMDADGEEADRPVMKGDYFRISIPGPSTEGGDGYDWVFVEEFKEVRENDMESLAFRVRPTSNPDSPSSEVAHFYSTDSTSSFTVTRKGKKISACIYDRNISPNENAETVGDKIRDKLVALAGINGMSKLQWQALADGVLDI